MVSDPLQAIDNLLEKAGRAENVIPVSVTGLPGDMASLAAGHITGQPDMGLIEYALTGPDQPKEVTISGRRIELASPTGHNLCLLLMKKRYPDLVIVDYSKGKIEELGALYTEHEIPFVFGGTVGDRTKLTEIVKKSNISALIAPNMSLELNLFPGSYLEQLAEEFPGVFKGYRTEIIESHQKKKADVSGTARAWKERLEKLGMHVTIQSIRDPYDQGKFGIPKEYLGGHAYHQVKVYSPDGYVRFGWFTEVDGRETYAIGTPDSVRFVYEKAREGSKGEVFSKMDAIRWAVKR